MGKGETIMFINLNVESVQIDDEIVKEIITLNTKGYKTVTCCAGHMDEDSIGGYIRFESISAEYGVPKGWFRDSDDPAMRRIGVREIDTRTIRYNMNYQRGDEKQKRIASALRNLKKWVERLPDAKIH
jgi:hypothetical protein